VSALSGMWWIPSTLGATPRPPRAREWPQGLPCVPPFPPRPGAGRPQTGTAAMASPCPSHLDASFIFFLLVYHLFWVPGGLPLGVFCDLARGHFGGRFGVGGLLCRLELTFYVEL
jgi:hypothetical protein